MADVSTEYQLNQTDEYVNHLAKVEETNAAKASENIYNDQGVLLLAKGATITEKVAGLLIQHQLKKELDQTIHVSNSLTVYDILNQILELVESNSELNLLHQQMDFEVTLRQLLFTKPIPSQILQRLTVMSRVMPEVYQRSLFSAWFTPLIAKRMNVPSHSFFSAFSAGLAHDIGLMHIEVEAATARHSLTYQQWRAVKTHPIVGRIILENRKIYDLDTLDAIADHHERSDRSGYPAVKAGKQINWLASIVALSDQLFEIYFDPEYGRKSLQAWIPFLEVNPATFGTKLSDTVLGLLKDPHISSHITSDPDLKPDLKKITSDNTQVSALFSVAAEINDIATHYPRSRLARGITDLIAQLRWVQDSAGLGSDHLQEWLEWSQKNPDTNDNIELVEIGELLADLRWRFRRLWSLAVELSWSAVLSAEHQTSLEKLYAQITPYLPCPGRFDLESFRAEAQADNTEPTPAPSES
ncbi:HD domain-containing protein [Oceanospirillum multiglobuliferum]|uniref:HD-GYP domain-containing protein n=1 Tax=Oceanospirillum multiglobuliferum TaxID=64969 RepID=A0A1T4QN74_9GAMM|nr:HD domain-containing phosphohydrolase [Oceanospirillum multiglobuliferum]OPX56456.1 hypothetical protein BTE48_03240 [Oceanospirillum multiglobuliferum]SKA05220.1 HD domain-containing protein [Oceanospirillum multiglobuliferum]